MCSSDLGQVTRHSAKPAHRVFMLNCRKLHEFWDRLIAEDAVLMIEINGVSTLPDVHYAVSRFVAFDPKGHREPGEPWLLRPNTTTLVDVVLNRRQADELLVIKDCDLAIVKIEAAVAPPLTGRAQLVVPERAAAAAGGV